MKRLLGGLLMGVGGLIAVLCGLFTGGFLLTALLGRLFSGAAPAENLQMALSVSGLILMAGGIPTAIGVGLFAAGRSLLRSTKRSDER